jgi:hypothetical protein
MNNITGANLFKAQEERNLQNILTKAQIDAYINANKPPEVTQQFENANEKIPYFLKR